jgi:hypothetical protein
MRSSTTRSATNNPSRRSGSKWHTAITDVSRRLERSTATTYDQRGFGASGPSKGTHAPPADRMTAGMARGHRARPWCRWMPLARAAKIAYRESSKTKPRLRMLARGQVVLLLWEADCSQVGVPLFDVDTPQLPYLILEVELPLPHVPCVLATFERIRQSHPFPAPMQRGDAPSGRHVLGEELVEHAGHGAPG